MNTFQLSCFLAVAETLNFAQAALTLNISQPAVTHQIHSLEAELNVKLFVRSTRSVRLTNQGLIFINDARNILAISNRAKDRFAYPAVNEVLTFSIGCHSFTQLFILPEVLKQLAVQFPGLHPRLRVVPSRLLYRLLEEEDVDLILGFKEPDAKKTPGIYRELFKIPIVCICSCQNPISALLEVTLKDLEKETLILHDPAKSPESIVSLQGQLMGGRSPMECHFCESPEAALVLVKAGFGVCVLPDLFLPPDSDFVRLPVTKIPPVSFGIYYKSLQDKPLLKAFIKTLSHACQGKDPA